MVVRRLIRRAACLCARWRADWRRVALRAQVWFHGGSLTLSRDCTLHVPVRCDGSGTVRLGGGVSLGYPKAARFGNGQILLQARRRGAVIDIGARTTLNNNVTVAANARVEIGAECLIGDQVVIYDSDFHELRRADRAGGPGKVAPVKINDGVWLGSRVMVLKGVESGADAVIAAGAVVTRDIPPRMLAGGIPARALR